MALWKVGDGRIAVVAVVPDIPLLDGCRLTKSGGADGSRGKINFCWWL